jgi:penicillin-binding protein 2
MAHKLGLGEVTGVGLPGEQKGLMPTEAWKKAARGEPWQQGENLNVGIGQGQVTITPIQLCTYVARIANGGLAVKPTLVRATATTAAAAARIARDDTDGALGAQQKLESIGIPAQHIAIVQRGMFGCVNAGGTATAAAIRMKDPDKRDWQMAGKTGSTQVHSIKRSERALGERKQDPLAWELRDHALFIAFAPFHAPRYAASCVIEHGKAGKNAAMVVKDVMEEVLRLDPSRKVRTDDTVAAGPAPVPEKSPS